MKALFTPLLLFGTAAAWLISADAPTKVPLKTLLPGEPTEADLTRSRQLLESWENDQPSKQKRVMRVVYWTPADRDPQPEFRPRLTRVLQHIQGFYEKEMTSWGFPGRTIQLQMEPDGLMKIYQAKGKLKNAECSEADGADGQEIRRDALQALKNDGIDGDKETIVIFCNLAEWDPAARKMSHHSPYYASGDNRHGTAWQVDSPLLDPKFLEVKDQKLNDAQYGNISLGKYNSIFIGGVCHELGHALGLPHCKECPAVRAVRGTALMGGGNRTYGEDLRGESKGSFLSLPHALKLAAHPQFSGSVKSIETRVKAEFKAWDFKPVSDGLHVSGTVTANLPIHALLAYADPNGGADYDSEIAAAVPQKDGKFTLLLPRPEKKNCRATLHFVAVCANGSATASVWSAEALTFICRIDQSSAYDVTKTLEKLAFNENWDAFKNGTLATEQYDKLPAAAKEALRRVKLPNSANGKPTPSDVPAETKSIPLSDTSHTSGKTGWAGVHFDRTPDGLPLIGPDGLLAHGMYAHANSEFIYQLNGKWNRLSGICTLLEKAQGAVQGKITADDRVIWQSGKIEPGNSKPVNVDLKGVQILKLEIVQAAKNNNGAWGAWGEPVLHRD